jgi:hypothetical protein
MESFMPGTQPQGTYAFDPEITSQSATQVLDKINAEMDGEEDQVGPPLDLSVANIPVPHAHHALSPLVTPDLSSSFPFPLPSPSLLDPPASSFSGTRPPSSSSLAPTLSPHPQGDISMSSVHSLGSVGSSQHRKRKFDATMDSMPPPTSSKRASRSKTGDLNPVIILNALNSTLNRLADMMEKSLDATAAATSHTTTTASAPTSPSFTTPSSISVVPSINATQSSSMPSEYDQCSNPPNPSSSSEILDQAIRITTVDDSSLTENEMLAASLFFTSASDDAICAARTVIALGNNRMVRDRFLLVQLTTAALLPGKGKNKDDDQSMII